MQLCPNFWQCQQLISFAFVHNSRFCCDYWPIFAPNVWLLACITAQFYKMITTATQVLHTSGMTFFLQGVTQTPMDQFCWLDRRHIGPMHASVDGGGDGVGGLRHTNLKDFSSPTPSTCDTVRIRSGCLSLSTPDSLQPHGALWIVQFHFKALVFGPHCFISADWKYLMETQESVAIGR